MALNLNKGKEEYSKTSTEKKGFNISKSDDSVDSGFNLSKNRQTNSKLTSNPNQDKDKKKSTWIFVFAAVLILGAGSFWFINQKGNGIPESEVSNQIPTPSNQDAVTSTEGIEGQQPVPPIDDSNNSQMSTEEIAVPVSTGNGQANSSANAGSRNGNTNNLGNATQNTANSASSSITERQPQGSIEDKANQVIRGDFGNGAERKTALGSEYDAIQTKVNEIYKQL